MNIDWGVSVEWNKFTRDAFVRFSGVPRHLIFFLPNGTCMIRNQRFQYQKYDYFKMSLFWDQYSFRRL